VRRALARAQLRRRRRRAALVTGVAVIAAGALVAAVAGGEDPRAPARAALDAGPAQLRGPGQGAGATPALATRRAASRDREVVRRTRLQVPLLRAAGAQTRSVALTFDDGPSRFTAPILAALRRGNAKATFFVVGTEVQRHPEPLRAAVAAGHAIGSHSWNHPDLRRLAPALVDVQLRDTAFALYRLGVPPSDLFRPPYGAFDAQVLAGAGRRRLLTVLWSVDSGDYTATRAASLARGVLARVRPGAVILLHDGGGDRAVTARAVPRIVRGLQRRGYRMLTLPQLLRRNPPAGARRAGA
jgi:peptidoglycan/xylan/chitin deacetylase (PgdA/CDA1 family)